MKNRFFLLSMIMFMAFLCGTICADNIFPQECNEHNPDNLPEPMLCTRECQWGKQGAKILITCKGCNAKVTPAKGYLDGNCQVK